MNGRLSNPAAPARDSALDALRILACLLVVANHTLGYALNTGAPGAELFYCLLFSLCKTGVTLFVMVSGILLLDREDGFRKTGRRILRVLVPLLAVSALLAWKDEGLAGLAPLRFLASFLRDPRRAPYWYLYALIGFYLLLPFLQKMTRGFRLADYAAFSGLFLLLPCALDILRVFCGLELSGTVRLDEARRPPLPHTRRRRPRAGTPGWGCCATLTPHSRDNRRLNSIRFITLNYLSLWSRKYMLST